MSYDEYRQSQIEQSAIFQDFVVDCFWTMLRLPITVYSSRAYQFAVGESAAGVEIKHDRRFRETGNLYIEVAEMARPRSGDMVPSGILRNDNAWLYVIGDYDTVYVLAKTLLVGLYGSNRYRIVTPDLGTGKGFLLPVADADRYAATVLRPNASGRIAKSVLDAQAKTTELYRALVQGQYRGGTHCHDPHRTPDG